MNCTLCKLSNKIKREIVKDRQRYACKDCGYNYTVEQKSTSKPDSKMRREGGDFVIKPLRVINATELSGNNYL